MSKTARKSRVAETVHFALVHHYDNADNIKRMSPIQLKEPLNFSKFTDIETTNFARGLVRLCSQKKMNPYGLRVESTMLNGHVGRKASVLLRTEDMAESYILYTFGSTERKDNYFTWELRFHHRFKKVTVIPNPQPDRTQQAEATQRIIYGNIVFTTENNSLIYDGENKCIFMFGTATIIVNGRRINRHLDIPLDFLQAVDSNRQGIPLSVIIVLQQKIQKILPTHENIPFTQVINWLIMNNKKFQKPKRPS